MEARRIIARVLAVTTFTAMLATTSVGLAGASSGSRSAKLVTTNNIKYIGTADVAALGKHSHQAPPSSDKWKSGGLKLSRELDPKGDEIGTAPSAGPAVKGLPVHTDGAGPQPYDGVTAADSRLARDGNQYTNVPPDGGICSGGKGIKVQTVNSAFGFFDKFTMGAQPKRNVSALSGCSSRGRRSSMMSTSTPSRKPAWTARSSPPRSTKRNFSGNAKYSCKRR